MSTAYFLTVGQGVESVVLCDPLPPLTLTSDKSTECYRNWWPDPSMAAFVRWWKSRDEHHKPIL